MTFGDVRDAAVRQAAAGCSVVFHTAGVVAVSGPALAHMFAVHTDGTRNVLTAAPPGARIVHTSSAVAVGPAVGRQPVAEDSPFALANRRLPYVASKRAAEELALAPAAAGRDVVIVNPTHLVGPEDYDGSMMGRFCHRFWRGRMQLVSPGGVNVVDVRDAAAGHVLAAERGRAGRRYILGGTDQTYAALAAELARAAGLRPRTTAAAPRWAVFALAGVSRLRSLWTGREPFPTVGQARMSGYHWFARSDRAAAELGYTSRPLSRTLADTYQWYQSQQSLRLNSFGRWWLRPAA
jgi:dihydroflavonol-4-reductase